MQDTGKQASSSFQIFLQPAEDFYNIPYNVRWVARFTWDFVPFWGRGAPLRGGLFRGTF